MNTREAIKNLRLVGSGVVILSVAGLAFVINRGLNNRKVYKRNFDTQTVEELEGNILDVEYSENRKEEIRGVQLFLETNHELVKVHLGPAWYIDRQDKRLKAGQTIKVVGSRTKCNGEECLVAQTVTLGKQTLRLRDKSGTPFWYGWMKA